MQENSYRTMKYLLIGVCGSLLMLWIMSSILARAGPNEEIVRMAREAIEIAEDARRDAEMARKTSSALRIIGLVLGITGPLLLAYLIYRMQSRREPGVEDVLEVMQKEKLINLPEHAMKRMPKKSRRYLEDPSKGKETELNKD